MKATITWVTFFLFSLGINAALPEDGLIVSRLDSAEQLVAKANLAMQAIQESNQFIGFLGTTELASLPVGLRKQIGGINYDIAITKVTLWPRYAQMEVFMQIEIPQNGKKLTFYAPDIKLSSQGGIIGEASLQIIGTYGINLPGDNMQMLVHEGTSVTFDCDGYQSMHLLAGIQFSRDLIIPTSEDGHLMEGRVEASFETDLVDWNNILVEASMASFSSPSLSGWVFKVDGLVFDFSDLQNAANLVFPGAHNGAGLGTLWRGVFIREFDVQLPSAFRKANQQQPLTFSGTNLLIDEKGFSGNLSGNNLMDLSQGDLGGWKYSLVHMEVLIAENQLIEANFRGELLVPAFSENEPLPYEAIIDPSGRYAFQVGFPETVTIPLFKTSEVILDPSSHVRVELINGSFRPSVSLNGQMTIATGGNAEGEAITLADIQFQELVFATTSPYVTIGAASFGSEGATNALSGFPVSIQRIRTSSEESEVSMHFDLVVNLMGENNQGLSAITGLTIVGESGKREGRAYAEFKRLDIHRMEVDYEGPAFHISGSATFFKKDPTYGNGFQGSLTAEIMGMSGFQAQMLFGNIDGNRFWYADLLKSFEQGMPVAGPMNVYGLGGGLYHGMTMRPADNARAAANPSGINYIPEASMGLGLKATAQIGMKNRQSFNGDATLEMAFFRSGGIRYIAFKGNGYFMSNDFGGGIGLLKNQAQQVAQVVTQASATEESLTSGGLALFADPEQNQNVEDIYGPVTSVDGQRAAIAAHVFLNYDFTQKTLHGNFEAYVNAAGGLISGTQTSGRAGWAVLHVSPAEWYIMIGEPKDRLGLRMGMGPLSAQVNGYFMMGTQIPGSPAPDENVGRILGGLDLDYMRDENALGRGSGIAFGAAFGIDTGDLRFLMFYARFMAGAGFDIMLKNYGNVSCAGRGALGVNGWYANGQAYGYFDGAIGIRVRVFGMRRNVEVLEIGAAAILQAKLPNPTWMRGIVGGRFSVLGGLVSGRCRFQVTIGEECEIVDAQNIIETLDVISQVNPADGEEVSVFSAGQVLFNFSIDEEFQLVDLNQETRHFRISLDHLNLTHGSNSINGEREWNQAKDVVAFTPHDILPPNSQLTLSVSLSFQEKTNGRWVPVQVDGRAYQEVRSVKFKTGEAPDHIPIDNVAFSYPMIGQSYFLPKEFAVGYIQLKRGQPYLFDTSGEWMNRVIYEPLEGEHLQSEVHYQNGRITYELPKNIKGTRKYQLRLNRMPARDNTSVDKNVTVSLTSTVDNESAQLALRKREAEGQILAGEKELLSYEFETSRFKDFTEKWKTMNFGSGWLYAVENGVHEIGVNASGVLEGFGEKELAQSISLMALGKSKWLNEEIQPLLYHSHIPTDISIGWRKADPFGIPPLKAIDWRQSSNYVSAVYNLSWVAARDYMDLVQQAAIEVYKGNQQDWSMRIIQSSFPVIKSGKYPVKFNYRLPGEDMIHQSREIMIKVK